MYEITPIYGNHVGMVISNQDPESRNRIQVFVPHISNTLFEGWNKNGDEADGAKDISLVQGDLNSLNKKNILQRLEKMLPWAEMACPLFGANGSAYTNPINGNLLPAGEGVKNVVNVAQNSGTVDKQTVLDNAFGGNKIPNSATGENLNCFTEDQIMNYRSGKDISSSLTEDQQEVLNQFTSQGMTKEDALNQMMKDTGNFYKITQNQYDDNGKLQLNSEQQNNLNRIKDNYGVDEKTALAMMTTGAPSPQNLNSERATAATDSTPVTGKQGWQKVYDVAKSLGDPYPEVTASQWALESGWGKHMSGTNNPFGQTATSSQDGTVKSTKQYNTKTGTMYETTQKFRNYGSLEESIQDHLRIWKPKYESASNATEALNKIHAAGYANYNHTYTGEVASIMNRMGHSGSGGPSPNATPSSLADGSVPVTKPSAPTGPNISSTSPLAPMDMRESNGIVSVPPPGTMVWVFFVGGDPNKPVYFAGVSETNAGGRMAPLASYSPPGNSAGSVNGAQSNNNGTNAATANGDLGDVALNSLNGPLHRGQNRDGVHCYAGVKTSLLQAGAISNYSDLGSTYALDAVKDLSNNPNFERITVSNPSEIPYNAVSVWGNGYPGHIDIKAKDSSGNPVYVSDISRNKPPNMPLQAVFVRKNV